MLEFERPTADQEAAKEKKKAVTPDVEQHREEQDASQLPNEAGETEGKTEIYYYMLKLNQKLKVKS